MSQLVNFSRVVKKYFSEDNPKLITVTIPVPKILKNIAGSQLHPGDYYGSKEPGMMKQWEDLKKTGKDCSQIALRPINRDIVVAFLAYADLVSKITWRQDLYNKKIIIEEDTNDLINNDPIHYVYDLGKDSLTITYNPEHVKTLEDALSVLSSANGTLIELNDFHGKTSDILKKIGGGVGIIL